MDVRIKRVYDPPALSDGYRVLIDRLWPRGVSRGRAKIDSWERELPPSTELRQWFGHEPGRFEEFRRRYMEELHSQRPRLAELRRRAQSGVLTLIYSAWDTEHNDAVVLAEVLRRGLPGLPGAEEPGGPRRQSLDGPDFPAISKPQTRKGARS
jgi:uncharacterized protein YeaO (DUF488 family)